MTATSASMKPTSTCGRSPSPKMPSAMASLTVPAVIISFRALEIVGQEALVDQLAPIDVALERIDQTLGADHVVHALAAEVADAPVTHAGLLVARGQIADRSRR